LFPKLFYFTLIISQTVFYFHNSGHNVR
jgi:hypothetical protein